MEFARSKHKGNIQALRFVTCVQGCGITKFRVVGYNKSGTYFPTRQCGNRAEATLVLRGQAFHALQETQRCNLLVVQIKC